MIYILFVAFWATCVLANQSKVTRVKYPASIQTALDCASRGDKIIVEAGTYSEQISITKSGITLVGKDATIIPPGTPITNSCTGLAGPGTQAGICIAGSDIVHVDQPFNGEHKKVQSVGKPVRDVSVSGFQVQGFSGLNIAVLGAIDADVKENTVSAGLQYGMLTVGSKRTDIKHNVVLPGGFIAICMDDISEVEVADNEVSGYFIGLCIQTSGADVHDNFVHDSCIGAFVDPGIVGAKVHNNTISNTGAWCNPNYGVSGIALSGAIKAVIRNNVLRNIKNSGKSVGLYLEDNTNKFTGAVTHATGDEIRKNIFTSNDFDIFANSTGTGNVFKKNSCVSSFPESICSGNWVG